MELAEQAQSRGQVTFQLQALHDVARLGGASRVTSSLRRAAAGAEGQLAPLYVSHAAALEAHDGLALDQIARGFAALGFNLLAAEAAAEAARALQAEGRRTAAEAAATTATTLTAQCEGARTPALDLLSRATSPPVSSKSPRWPHAGCPARRSRSGWSFPSAPSTTHCTRYMASSP